MNFDGIYNYYEQLVYDEIRKTTTKQAANYSEDDAEDIACLALNHLPARYVRHSVDIAYYLDDAEKAQMEKAVSESVAKAIARVMSHPGNVD